MPNQPSVTARLSVLLFIVVASMVVPSAEAQTPPGFSKTFAPNTVGPGGTSRLTFEIDNASGTVISQLAFTDNLPAGLTLADGANPISTCGGTLTAPDGGSTISLTDGAVSANQTCTISVFVTASTLGTLTNTTGDLTSAAGNSGTATDDLDVVNDRPAFSKAFSPTAIPRGSRSTLTFSIDNSANASFATSLSFVDVLPSGMEIADPSNLVHDCTGSTVTAESGTQTISLAGSGFLLGGESCTITVDVIATGAGVLTNVSSELFSSPGGPQVSSGFATATLDVSAPELSLIKRFTDDPTVPGGTVTLEFTVENFNRTDAAANIAFTDDLDATLSGLVALGLPQSNVCGAGSTLSGASTISLTGGNLPPQGSCTFQVTLQVPGGATAGVYPNTTSPISAVVGGSPVTGPSAGDSLFVSFFPQITKSFLTDPIGVGESVDLEFTITNTSSTSAATDIAFTDNLTQFYSGAVASALPAAGFCGAGSIAFIQLSGGESLLAVAGGNLAPSASCAFTVTLQIPVNGPGGTFLNQTSPPTAVVDGTPASGFPASDTLTVVAAPRLTKSFTDDPAQPGDTVNLEFTISHIDTAPADATGITFSDDLSSVITGMAATGLPLNDVCGTGSQISGTTNLSFTGGTLAPGASCTFSVPVTIPAAAVPGVFPNTTSNLVATVGGQTVTGSPGADNLIISGLSLSKEFIDDPALPGGQTTLRFTIDNTAGVDATGMFFTDSLGAVISGLAAASLPTNPCGAGSTITGPSSLIFTGGNLLAGESCTFDVVLDVPAGAGDGQYLNTTSSLTATVGGSSVVLTAAADVLEVTTDLLNLSKEFTDDPVAPGSTVTLEFTVTNLDASNPVDSITFSDDFGAFYPGLAATNTPLTDQCGTGSQVVGTGSVTLVGGSLPAGGSCTFALNLQVPPGDPGTPPFINSTSTITGEIGGIPVSGGAAVDELRVLNADFTKSFDGPSTAGGAAILSFTISNLSATTPLTGLAFTDDLDAVVSGLVATGLPLTDACGTGSTISGTSFLTFSGGSVLPGGTCTIDVPVQIPMGATPGTYPNTSSELNSSGLPVAPPAIADLAIEPPPTFAKAFAPATISVAQVSTLTFTIDNSASALAATNLDFTDSLPAGTIVATPGNASTTCSGGTLTAVDGSSVVTYTGGTAPAGGSCTITVDIAVTGAGTFVNTSGDLTSDSGTSGSATDTLTATAPPAFAKAFAPATAFVGSAVTLTFTIDNAVNPVAATSLDFTDSLPAGLEVAAPANGSVTCTGGTLTAVSGTSSVSYSGGSVPAGATCTVSVDVTATVTGDLVNTSGALTSSLGVSGIATDTLRINPAPAFAKAFAPNTIDTAEVSTLTFTIDNSASTVAATSLDFTDSLPAGTVVATPANASNTCTGGTLTAVDGTGTVSYTGGTIAAGGICTVSVDIAVTGPGAYDNLSGDLTSDAGNSGQAADTLTAGTPPSFTKAFAPAAAALNEIVTLTFTIDNTANPIEASALAFSDSFPAGLEVASPANSGTTCTGGLVTAAPGGTTVAYSGGTVSAGASCTVSVDVVGTIAGDLVNLTGDLTSSAGSSGTATDTLQIQPTPTFAKAFGSSPILVGGVSTLTFTIDNTGATLDATGLAFTDTFPAGMTIAPTPNASSTCSGGTLTAGAGAGVLTYSGGTATAGTTCTVQADVTVTSDGTYDNTSSDLSSSLGTAPAATDTLIAVDTPISLAASFTNSPVVPGGPATIEYTVSNLSPDFTANALTFSDDLDAALAGLAATGLPLTDACGPGSQVNGTSVVTLTGGTLAPSASCTFQVTVLIPPAAGDQTVNTSSGDVSGDLDGLPVTGAGAAAAFDIAAVVFEKLFLDDANAGGTVGLRFTVTNPDPVNPLSDIAFTDDLDAVLPGLAATGLPTNDVCGLGSTLDGGSTVTLTGGTLAVDGSCTFDITVAVPAGTPAGLYTNITSDLGYIVAGVQASGTTAEDDLEVVVQQPAIPTLGHLGLWILIGLIALIGALAIRRSM